MNPQINYLLNLSIQHIQSNKLDDAERLLNQILRLQPKHADALCFLSVVAAKKYDFKNALKLINASISSASRNPVAYNNQGNILKELGRYSDALMSYEKAIALAPNYEEAHNNKGNTLQDLGKYQDAVVCYDKALSLSPGYAEALCNKGNALQKLGLLKAALSCYDAAIAIRPNYAEAWAYKGLIFGKLKRFEEASSCYNSAVTIDPHNSEAWNLIGMLFCDYSLYKQAVEYFEKAIDVNASYASAWSNKGLALSELGSYGESLAAYQRVMDMNVEHECILGHLVHAKLQTACWEGLDEDVEELGRRVNVFKKATTPFNYLSAIDSPRGALNAAKVWVDDKHPKKNYLPPLKKSNHPKIRVGYFSPDFKSHPVSLLTAELFELHDRNKFEIFAFSLKKAPDGDQMRARLIDVFDHFLDVQDKSDLEIVDLVRNLEIDIAIDLAGHTQYGPTEIFSHRVAPIQINYLGYPGTSGAQYMDYIIADQIVVPEMNQQFFTEKIAYLPNTYMVDDSKRQPSSRVFTRTELGLPEIGFIFCCFNNSYKFNKKTLQSWARIISSVPGSVIWISGGNELFKNNIVTEFKRHGVDEARIIFAKRVDSMADHLARLSSADLFLDTLPFNAHTTAIDALKAGLPLLACTGEAFAGRVSSSLLNAIGLPELIVKTMAEYENVAIELATHPDRLVDLKLKLQKNRATTPLFNTKLFVDNLESAYDKMYSAYLADEPFNHIYV
jgi:predicted O-linked N-acetylglucosamine transferase (SPINDLY family)